MVSISSILLEETRKFGLNAFKRNWFTENGNREETFAWSIHVQSVVHRERSRFKDILVFDSERFGGCLALDDKIQRTAKDECVLSEMLAFMPLNSHPHPCSVLVVGAENAGIAREASKHPYVEKIVLCEPDEVLIEICKNHVPFIRDGLQCPKLELVLEDPSQYLRKTREEFDVVVAVLPYLSGDVSSSLETPAFKALNASLRPGGILVCQASCFWFDVDRSKEFIGKCRTVFPAVDYASVVVPSLPGGQRGIVLCGASPSMNFREPTHKFTTETLKNLQLKYYTPDIHRNAFSLPLSIREDLGLLE